MTSLKVPFKISYFLKNSYSTLKLPKALIAIDYISLTFEYKRLHRFW